MNHVNSKVWPATKFDAHNGVQICFNWSRLGLILGARCVKTVTEAQVLPRISFVISLGSKTHISALLSSLFTFSQTQLVQ
jgi:hypothetical protein